MEKHQALIAEIPQPLYLLGWGVVGVLALVFFIIIINFLAIWVRALVSGARVTYLELLALRLRNVPVGLIVDNRINAVKSGLDIAIDQLNAHFLAGGNVEMVVRALIMARKAGINLEYDRACAIDLATARSPVRLFWCNARVPALRFYQRHGWRIVSDQFDIPTAGPHRKLVKRLGDD